MVLHLSRGCNVLHLIILYPALCRGRGLVTQTRLDPCQCGVIINILAIYSQKLAHFFTVSYNNYFSNIFCVPSMDLHFVASKSLLILCAISQYCALPRPRSYRD